MPTGQSFPETHVFLLLFLLRTALLSLSLYASVSLSLLCVWVSVRRRKEQDERKEEAVDRTTDDR